MLIQKLYKTDTDNYMQSTIVSSFFFLRKKLNDNYVFITKYIFHIKMITHHNKEKRTGNLFDL